MCVTIDEKLPRVVPPGMPPAPSGPWAGEFVVLPSTVAQQGFWYLDQLEPGNPAYNIAVRFRLQGPLQVPTLARAMNEIVRRQESLRTAFEAEEGQPVQLIAPSLTIPMLLVDLRGLPDRDRARRSEELTVEEARRRFDLEAGPLIRASLLRSEDEEHVLLVTVHHIVADGWSIGVLTQELGALYEAFRLGQDSPLPEPPIQFGDFAVWQKRWLEDGSLSKQLSYWKRRLADLTPLEVATDRPRPAIRTSNGHIESFVMPRRLSDSLRELALGEGGTFFMLALAALKVLLGRLSGQADVYVGTLDAGRDRVELEALVGLFVNPLVLRTDLSGDPPFLEAFGRVRDTVLGAMDNRNVPFERVVEAVRPKRDPSRHPLFQINFIYQRDFVRPSWPGDLTLTALPSRSPGAIYDLNFFMVEREDGWRVSCEYNTDLYDASTVSRLLGQYHALLQGIAAGPSRRISALPMVAAADRPRLPAGNSPPDGSVPVETSESSSGPVSRVEPRGEIEARLEAIFRRVLGVDRIGVTADFFDEGGHSLLAAKLLSQVERSFGLKLSLGTLLQASTVESLAAKLREAKLQGLDDRLYVIQPQGLKPPLIFVDGGPIFRPLSRRLGFDQPVIGLSLQGIAELPKRFTIEDIASQLVETLFQVQPKGPYYLGGWCNAGIIAYELARQVRARGEEVALLILLDTVNPRYRQRFRSFRSIPARLYIFCEKLRYHGVNLWDARSGGAPAYLGIRLRKIHALWLWRFRKLWYRRLSRPAPEKLRRSTDFLVLAVGDYHPEPGVAPLALFRSALFQTGRFRDDRLGWGGPSGAGVEVHDFPCEHDNLLQEPMVESLAARLARSLETIFFRHQEIPEVSPTTIDPEVPR